MGVIKWRPGRNFIFNGVGLAMLVPPMSSKDHNIVGASVKIECMPLT